MSEMKKSRWVTVTFSGYSDDLLVLDASASEREIDPTWDWLQIVREPNLDPQEMSTHNSEGWKVVYPCGEGFFVAGRYGYDGVWSMTIVAAGSHEEDEQPEPRFPSQVHARHEIVGKGYSLGLTVTVPAGTTISGWPK